MRICGPVTRQAYRIEGDVAVDLAGPAVVSRYGGGRSRPRRNFVGVLAVSDEDRTKMERDQDEGNRLAGSADHE
jgi:hypothetical protein